MQNRICPRCGSRKTAPILWGMPAYNEELQEKIDNKEIILGGCCITENDPTHHCFGCKKDFGKNTADFETDTIGVSFSIGGFFSGYQKLNIIKNESGAIATYTPPFAEEVNPPIEKQLSVKQWLNFVGNLYRCYILDWKKRQDDPNVLDGTQWDLEIKFGSRKPLKIYGSNMFPSHWSKFLKVIKKLGYANIKC